MKIIGAGPLKAADRGDTRDREEARYFLEVLLRHLKLLDGKTVAVVEFNGDNLNDGGFIAAVKIY